MGRLGKHIETVQSTLLPPTEQQRKSTLSPDPFVKWAGGKGQLLRQYESFFPSTFKSYIEPFVGGGAVCFHLFRTGRLKKKVVLIDSNEKLINCYQAIKINPEKLIKTLRSSKYKSEKETYYRIRGEEPREMFRRAARTIYLNKTCFNGLYRVNRKGKFNVPFGRYKNPLICDSANLKVVSAALQNVEIVCGDFGKCLEFAKKGDFIYFDPPYQPLSKTSSFTSYTSNSFGEDEQRRLSEVFKELDRRGCKVMLSNSHTKLVESLYEGFRLETVLAKRAINSRASGRGPIREYVILNH